MTLSETAQPDAWTELERGVHAALATYSNVHRGTGQHSIVSTELYERAREIVLDHLGLDAERYVVIFCSAWRAETLRGQLDPSSYQVVSSRELGLPLGLRALAVRRSALPRGVPFQTGGDTVELVMLRSVVWADAPHKFEAGTPSIVNVITLAKALRVLRRSQGDGLQGTGPANPLAEELSQDQAAAIASRLLHEDRFSRAASGADLLHKLRRTLVGRDARVPTATGLQRYINLDNGASTPTFEPIWDVARLTWRQPAPVQSELVRQVREIVARFLGAPEDEYEVVFCGNTTEALNLAAINLGTCADPGVEPVVLNTTMEHHSNELPWRYVRGVSWIRMPVDGEGFLDLGQLERTLDEYNLQTRHGRKRVRLVAVSGASNVLGSFNDLGAICTIAHKYGARVLVDGAQLVAHRSVNLARDGVDWFAFSGHKVYAPFGSGALVARRALLKLNPFVLSAIRASGEENVTGIAALGKAMLLLERIGMDVIEAEERALTVRALRGLARVPGVRVLGVSDPDAPTFPAKGGVIVFESATTPRNLVAKELGERAGIGVRDGCFCAHIVVRELIDIHPIRTWIGALGLHLAPEFFRTILPGVVRVSLGLENDAQDVDALIHALTEISCAPRSWPNRVIAATHNGTWMLPRTITEDQIAAYAAACVDRVYS